MPVKISKPAINLREELASLRNQGGLPKEDKLYLDDLVTNGDFSNGTTGWNSSYSNLTSTNGTLLVTNTANNGWAYQTINTEAGKTYRISVNVVTENANNLWFVVSSDTHPDTNQLLNKVVSTTGVQTETFVATGSESTVILRVNGASGANIEFDNVSVQEVGENLVTNGTFDTGTTGWTEVDANNHITLTHNSGKLRLTSTTTTTSATWANQLLTGFVAGRVYTVNASVVVSGSANVSVLIHNPYITSFPEINSTGLYSFTFTATSSTHDIRAYVAANFTAGSYVEFDNITVTEGNHQVIQSIPYGYDVKDVYIDGELAREGEAYDYQVQTDGINQWLKPTVEPTATTETVVIGVRK